MDMHLTKLEKQWVLYDVGNSAFILMVSTIIPIYFNSLTSAAGLPQAQYLAYWGYAASISTLLVAVAGPIAGTMADRKNFKRPLFLSSVLIGGIGCGALGLCQNWLVFLGVFLAAKIAYSFSLIFYDSMLTDICPASRMDFVSSQGFAWGYLGSCLPFLASLFLVLGYGAIGISFEAGILASFLMVAVWWLLFALPLFMHYQQLHFTPPGSASALEGFCRLFRSMGEIYRDKHIFYFLLAFFFYIDGVYTIMEMATSYGKSLGLENQALLLALLMTQIVAFPCSILFGRLSRKFPAGKLITVCITAYLLIALFALQLDTQWEFWFLAFCVGIFQGGIQALSRSYFAKIIPPENSGEYFGILDIFGKGASFLGTMLVSITTQVSGSASLGVGSIVVIFLIGLYFFRKAISFSGTS